MKAREPGYRRQTGAARHIREIGTLDTERVAHPASLSATARRIMQRWARARKDTPHEPR
jgi:hypothetical protein